MILCIDYKRSIAYELSSNGNEVIGMDPKAFIFETFFGQLYSMILFTNYL